MTNNELATRVASLERVAIRFERLERGMRRWRRLAAVLVVGLVVGLVVVSWGEDEIPDVVKAREFQVVNKDGELVALMVATEYGGGVVVKNKAGKIAAGMSAGVDGGGGVVVNNKAGKLVWSSPKK